MLNYARRKRKHKQLRDTENFEEIDRSIIGYDSVNCCIKTTNVDVMLTKFSIERNEIVSSILNDPKNTLNLWNNLSVDSMCLCNLGQMKLRTHFSCAQCRNLRRLKDFKKGLSQPFMIECGKESGTFLVLHEFGNVVREIKIDDELKSLNRIAIGNNPALAECFVRRNEEYITLDLFSNEVVQNFLLERLLKETPHYIKPYTAFICRDKGYTLTEFNEIVTLEEALNYATPMELLLQILVILSILAEYSFSHGTPTLDSLLFTKEICSYTYQSTKVESKITVKLTNLTHSSVSVKGIRLLADTPKTTNKQTVKNIKINEIKVKSCVESVCKDEEVKTMKITELPSQFVPASRQLGLSFDLYAFLVSLMVNKSFYEAINNDAQAYYLWSMLWLPLDLEEIEKRVVFFHGRQSPDVFRTIEMLRGLELRCDAIQYLLNLHNNL
jgi:hypothetical protein